MKKWFEVYWLVKEIQRLRKEYRKCDFARRAARKEAGNQEEFFLAVCELLDIPNTITYDSYTIRKILKEEIAKIATGNKEARFAPRE